MKNRIIKIYVVDGIVFKNNSKVTLRHLDHENKDDCLGLNIIAVEYHKLCKQKRKCTWCDGIRLRIESRIGGVGI